MSNQSHDPSAYLRTPHEGWSSVESLVRVLGAHTNVAQTVTPSCNTPPYWEGPLADDGENRVELARRIRVLASSNSGVLQGDHRWLMCLNFAHHELGDL
jgi:hypothetical protein